LIHVIAQAHDRFGSAIELASGSAALASHVIARVRRTRGNPSLAYLYIFPTDIALCRMALGDRKILRFVSYSYR